MGKFTFTPLADSDWSTSRRGRVRQPGALSLIIDNTCRVYITQIPFSRIEQDGVNALRSEFEAFGPVEAYKMFTDRTGRFVGSVLCTYRNPADASAAVQHMNNQEIDGSTLKVSLSRDHGVVLLHKKDDSEQGQTGDNDGIDGKWKHDWYQENCSHEGERGGFDRGYVFPPGGGRGGPYGRRGGGRGYRMGRRGRGFTGKSIEDAFERYIASRDFCHQAEASKGDKAISVGGTVCEVGAPEIVSETAADTDDNSNQPRKEEGAPAEVGVENEES